MDRLYLPDHASFYFCGQEAVFVDLRRAEYSATNEEQCAALREVVANGGSTTEQTLRALEEPIRYGLLTRDARNARPISPTEFSAASTPLLEEDEPAPGKIDARKIANFFCACARVDIRLRWGTIYSTVMRVRRVRAETREHETDIDRLRELAGVFRTLRPWYPRPYVCLFDTLALLEFLALYRAFPLYVFGYSRVTSEAHCWAQAGELLILDDPELLARYHPLAVI